MNHLAFLNNNKKYLFLFLYAFAYIFVSSLSSPLYPFNYSLDSNIYFVMGKGLFSNSVIYKDLFDHKGPLLYFIYGMGSLFSKTSFTGVYIMESLNLFFCLFFGYKIASLYLTRRMSLYITLLFPIFFLLNIVNYAGSSEEFVSSFIIASLYFYLSYTKQGTVCHPPKYMLIHGMMMMSVFLIKMNLVVVWVGFLSSIFIRLILQKEYKNVIINLLAFILGLFVIALPFLLYFLRTNSLSDFIEAYWTFNFLYAKASGMGSALVNILLRVYYLLRTNPVTVMVILTGIFSFVFSKKYVPNLILRVGIIISFVLLFSIIYSQQSYDYYFIPICLFSILGCISIFDLLTKLKPFNLSGKIFLLTFCSCIFIGFFRDKDNITNLQKKYNYQTEFAQIINKETNPTLLAISYGPYDVTEIYNHIEGLIPNVKYFYHPNISNEKYPIIYDTQMDYIKDRKCMFLCISSFSNPYQPSTNVLDNYELISVGKDLKSEEYNVYAYYYLYKLKDQQK